MPIRVDRHISADSLVNVYSNAYFYRLLECLYEEFPTTLAVVGSDNFSALTRGYCRYGRLRSPRYLSRAISARVHFQSFAWPGVGPFITDLAKLERTILEVFHAPAAPALSDECMRAIPPRQWSSTKLEIHPAVKHLAY